VEIKSEKGKPSEQWAHQEIAQGRTSITKCASMATKSILVTISDKLPEFHPFRNRDT